MKLFLHITYFEWLSLWRSNTLKTLLLIVLGAGIYGIFFGKFEIDKQQQKIEQVKQHEIQQMDSLMAWVQLDTTSIQNKQKWKQAASPVGVGWNKHFTYFKTHQASDGAGLCLGQRDLYPVYYAFNVSDLARQVNTAELANPTKLLSGNFDLSYVYVFIFPLLLIALFYNLYAGEKEGGTLSILQAQSCSLWFLFLSKGIVRVLIVWGLAAILLTLGFWIQGISIANNLGLFSQWAVIISMYCLIWAAVMACIVWFRLHSALSAMIGLSVWLLCTLVLPAMLNLFVLANETLPNRTEMLHTYREMNGEIWGQPKSYVLKEFYADHPELNDGDTTNFHKWYYASFTLFDKKAVLLDVAFETQVMQRNALIDKWIWLAPAAMVQAQLSELSNTDRASHLQFMKEVRAYHAALKKLYYARIFSNKEFNLQDLQELEQKL